MGIRARAEASRSLINPAAIVVAFVCVMSASTAVVGLPPAPAASLAAAAAGAHRGPCDIVAAKRRAKVPADAPDVGEVRAVQAGEIGKGGR
eukprot:COSAG01_NODE_229_length_21089_cov_575.019194_18_plen_91_part_00